MKSEREKMTDRETTSNEPVLFDACSTLKETAHHLSVSSTVVTPMMMSEDEEKAIAVYHELKLIGLTLPGDNGTQPTPLPSWFDETKLRRALQFVSRYLFGLYFSHLQGLTSIIYVQSIYKPLVATKKSATVSCLFRRYLDTLTHVKSWYDGKLWISEDPSFKSLMTVRNMHKMVADRLNRNVPAGSPVAISQYDMLVTQFGFIGFVVLFPQKYGIKWKEYDLTCFIALWRFIGYLLGIDDKYNLCARSIDQVKILCQQIYKYEVQESFNTARINQLQCNRMSQGIIESIQPYIPLISWDAYLKHLINVMDSNEEIKLTKKNKLVYRSMKFTLSNVVCYAPLGHPLNFLLRRAIKSAHRHKKQISHKLDVKYSTAITE